MPLVAACEKTRPAASAGVVDIPGTCVWAAMLTVLQDEVPECLSCLDASAFHTVCVMLLCCGGLLTGIFKSSVTKSLALILLVIEFSEHSPVFSFRRHILQYPRSSLVCTRLCMPCHLRLRLHCLLIQQHKAWRSSGERASSQYILG
jgi:hypothetical protein